MRQSLRALFSSRTPGQKNSFQGSRWLGVDVRYMPRQHTPRKCSHDSDWFVMTSTHWGHLSAVLMLTGLVIGLIGVIFFAANSVWLFGLLVVIAGLGCWLKSEDDE